MRSDLHSFLCTKSISPSTTKEGRRCLPKLNGIVLHALSEVEHWMPPPHLRFSRRPFPLSPCQSAFAVLVSILPVDSFILRAASLGGRVSSEIPFLK